MEQLNFDFENVQTTEFGIGWRKKKKIELRAIPIHVDVQRELYRCVQATVKKMKDEDEPQEYDPSDETASYKYIYLPLNSEMVNTFNILHHTENLENASMDKITDAFFYFARFTDAKNRLTAVRKITHFKSLGTKKHMVWFRGTLEFVKSPLFKLDPFFDVLIDSKYVHIIRPKSFEAIGELKQYILNSVAKNSDAIQAHIPFVDMMPVKKYADTRIRAARYLASIQSRGWATGIDREVLRQTCSELGVKIRKGEATDTPEDVIGFLEVLDRRRYYSDLAASTELFKASSRRML